jgi:hypothetical protein
MVDRLRACLDRPLDPRAGRWVLVLAFAVFLGVGVLRLLGELDRPANPEPGDPPAAARVEAPVTRTPALANDGRDPARRRQDPQDRRGSGAARRASRELRTHRALQHVPYRQRRVVIRLIGAQRSKAILQVKARSVQPAHEGWRRFLHRFNDSGDSYLPRFAGRRPHE